MRNEKFMKAKTKVAAAMFAAAMTVSGAAPVMTMTIPVMAEGIEWTQDLTVKNAEEGATVTGYQLVAGKYNSSNQLTGYKFTDFGTVDGVEIKDLALAEEVDENGSKHWSPDNTSELASYATTLANKLETLGTKPTGITFEAQSDKTTYTAKGVQPGLYLVIVKGTGANVYNPILLSVSVKDANDVAISMKGSEVDLALNNMFKNGSTTAYAKKTSADGSFKKEMTGTKSYKDGAVTDDTEAVKGDALAVGDTANFRISATMPSYSDDYVTSTLKYEITDKIGAGFDKIEQKDIDVTVGGANVGAGDATYSLTINNDGHGFVISFKPGYIKSLSTKDEAGRAIVIRYSSEITSDAGFNYDENTNHATLKYSNNPSYKEGDPEKEGYKDDTSSNSYVYTFGIGAKVNGDTGYKLTKDGTTYDVLTSSEVRKVSSEKGFNLVKDEETSTTTKTFYKYERSNEEETLGGAVFALYSDSNFKTLAKCSQEESQTTSTDDGTVTFTGLDEGEYYLKEISAPKGYTLSTVTYKIVIDANFNKETGIMTDYTITTYGGDDYSKLVSSATYTNETTKPETDGSVNDVVTVTTTESNTSDLGQVVNTKANTLPFTGGEGRYMLYLTAALMVGASGAFVILTKKADKKN